MTGGTCPISFRVIDIPWTSSACAAINVIGKITAINGQWYMWALWSTPDWATPNVRMINRHPAPGNADALRNGHRLLVIVEFDRSLTAVSPAALRPVAGYHSAIEKL